MRKEVNKAIRHSKETWMENKISNIEKQNINRNTKSINVRKKPVKTRIIVVKDENSKFT